MALATGVGKTTVIEYLRRAATAGVSWPLPEGLGEYRGRHPDGCGDAAFCEHYCPWAGRRWAGRLSPVMRQRHAAGECHAAGERMVVDYSGTRLPVIDPATGTPRPAAIFIAVRGASNMTHAEANWSQTLPNWIGAHTRAFADVDAVPALVVSDNLESGVTRACFREPEADRSYAEMAAHDGTAILPARPSKPRDKAKVEGAVLLVQRWIIARLRNRQFFSLEELNAELC